MSSNPSSTLQIKEIVEHCNNYRGADVKRSLFQLATTLVLFAAASGAMTYGYHSGQYWLNALLLLPAAGLLTRIFIFQHDCGHGSFMDSKTANDQIGRV